MKLTPKRKMAVAAVIVSWIAGFMATTVWVIGQPLWFAIPITVISIACLPLMVAALWVLDGGGKEGEGG